MEQKLKDAVVNYIDTIKQTECYQKYCKTLEAIRENPELYARVNEYRKRNYEIQNSANPDELFDRMTAFEEEFETLRENPVVDDFLRAELGFCRMIQEINLIVTEELDFDIGMVM